MGHIHEFNPIIYPTRLWVADRFATIDEIDELFYGIDDNGEVVSFKDNYTQDVCTMATTYPVSHKKTGWRGCLVIFHRRDMPLSTLNHEASHCTDWLLSGLGIESGTTFTNGEARAYYSEWVWNRLYDVKQGKVK